MVDQIQPDEYYLISEAGDLFSDKDKCTYVTSNEGSGVALVRHDPDMLTSKRLPLRNIYISEDKTAPGTPVVNWNDTNADGQKWLLILYK